MPLREDILAPIAGDNPSGIDLRYDTKLLIYDKIKEARRQDDDLAQGDWQSERKTANYPLVVKLAQDSIALVSKDLQLAAWLTEALLQTERYNGLSQGIGLCHRLMAEFWETIYPLIEEGDRELRARPLSWIGSMLDLPLRSLTVAGSYSWYQYKDSRALGYEDQVKTDKDRKNRSKSIEEGKIAPEVFDKAFAETPKAFYSQAEKDLDGCLYSLDVLEKLCDEKFEDDAPAFGKLRTGLTEVRQTMHSLLEKKREKEPDPVEAAAPPEVAEISSPDAAAGAELPSSPPTFADLSVSEPADRRQAVASVAAAAAFLRKREPYSPAPYLMLRGLRWGELRTGSRLGDTALLEAPPTELRQQVKRLALAKRWSELLEAGEQAMTLPCSRAWLDLQRLSVAACFALGTEYQPIATAIQTELRALLNDLPELLEATLLDDTPAANPETRAWLHHLDAPPQTTIAVDDGNASSETHAGPNGAPSWLAGAADAYVLAREALASGQEEKAFAIMRVEIGRQRSGRNRFRRTMQLIELAVAAGKDSIAQPLLDDVTEAIESHKLDTWEDPELVAGDLANLMKNSKKIQGSSSDKQKLFERICRLDPVQALSAG